MQNSLQRNGQRHPNSSKVKTRWLSFLCAHHGATSPRLSAANLFVGLKFHQLFRESKRQRPATQYFRYLPSQGTKMAKLSISIAQIHQKVWIHMACLLFLVVKPCAGAKTQNLISSCVFFREAVLKLDGCLQ